MRYLLLTICLLAGCREPLRPYGPIWQENGGVIYAPINPETGEPDMGPL